jgi:alcohol dehydrogenase
VKLAIVETVGGLDRLKIIERPEPRPGPREVLVRMRAASLNYRDLVAVSGGYGSQQKRENLVPLSDGAGEIAELGEGVRRWRVGDRVIGCFFPDWQSGVPTEQRVARALGGSADGVACEYRVFGEDSIVASPPHLEFAEAATLPCAALTAWVAVTEHGAILPGAAVLTQGTGGVALFALQFARLAGADVVSTSSSAEKLYRLRGLGATHLIDYTADQNWGQTAFKLAGGGVDLVVETGGAQTLSQSLRAVRMGGALSMIGVVTGARPDLNVPVLIMKSIRLYGAQVGNRDQLAAMAKAMERHRTRPVIDRTFALDELRAALEHLRSGRHVGKVCIAM